MGNDVGRVIANPLGVRAIAYTTGNIEAAELRSLTDAMLNTSKVSGNVGKITRQEFEDVLKSIEKFDPSDHELLSSLFTMFDMSGEGIVVIKEYVAGVGGILASGTSPDKFRLAVTLYNVADEKGNSVLKGDLRKILNALNDVISFFGDPVISAESIDMMVFDAFNPLPSPSTPLQLDECVTTVLAHPVTEILLSGQGKVKYTAK